MAGSFQDPPNNRFAYDIDGSAVVVLNGSFVDISSNYTATDMANLNSDVAVSGAIGVGYGPGDPCSCYINVIFPEARTVTHIYSADTLGGTLMPTENSKIWYSTNTTNGIDGVWTEIQNQVYQYALPLGDNFRNGISSVTGATNVRGIRVYRYSYDLFGGTRYHALHLYGDRPTNINRLAIWHPTNDQEVTGAELDYGNVYRGLSSEKTFRIKNLSSTLTASTISLSVSANGDYSPAFASMFTFNPTSIASLAPGAVSSVCTLTGAISTTAKFSAMSLRLVALASTWA